MRIMNWRRYSPFDFNGLCGISSLPSVASPISRVQKQGGYNKALLMTAENGRTVLAKSLIVPRHYATASEVAILAFGISRCA